MCSCPPKCDHTFAYWSVVPPTHCLKCGACLTCGSRRLHDAGRQMTVTITNGNTTAARVDPRDFAQRLSDAVAGR